MSARERRSGAEEDVRRHVDLQALKASEPLLNGIIALWPTRDDVLKVSGLASAARIGCSAMNTDQGKIADGYAQADRW